MPRLVCLIALLLIAALPARAQSAIEEDLIIEQAELRAMQPRSLQQQGRAQEAVGLREAQGRAMVGMQQTLAATNAPGLRLPAGTE